MARDLRSEPPEPARGAQVGRHVPPAEWRQAFEAELAPLLARTKAPGVGITLFDEGEVLLEAGCGHRDVERGLPVNADTIFGVASITKTFTAFSLQLLAQDGLLSLDDPVTDYLPFTLWEGRGPATLRHFLEHTSGLAPTPTMTWLRFASQVGDPVSGEATMREALTTVSGGLGEVGRLAEEVSSFEGLVDWLNGNAVLLAEPGELFSYSNDAFSLMGGVVECVSGLRFEEFVRRRILAPLGMHRSTFALEDVLADPNRATLYVSGSAPGREGEVRHSDAWQTTGRMLGGGMLKSTLADLRAWVRHLMASPLAREMAHGRVYAGPGSTYGLGLRIEDAGDLTLALMAVNAYAGRPVTRELHEPAEFSGSPEEAERLLRDLLGSYASGEPYGRLRLYLDDAGELKAAVGAPAQVVPAFLVGPDEVALRFEEYLAPVIFLRREEGREDGPEGKREAGPVWAAHHGSRVLLRQEGR